MKFEKKIKAMFTGVELNDKARLKRAKKQIENVIWHIDTNETVLGSEETLEDVRKSLKTIAEEL